ncbi:MAG: hypothetical protein JNK05_34955 [Myxococcales bacterium]|nr:hypothetical protein [Myxococcales bacterium]
MLDAGRRTRVLCVGVRSHRHRVPLMERGTRNAIIVVVGALLLSGVATIVSERRKRRRSEDEAALLRWQASVENSPEGIARRRAAQEALARQQREQWQRELDAVGNLPSSQPTTSPTDETDSPYVPHYRARHGGSWYRRHRAR